MHCIFAHIYRNVHKKETNTMLGVLYCSLRPAKSLLRESNRCYRSALTACVIYVTCVIKVIWNKKSKGQRYTKVSRQGRVVNNIGFNDFMRLSIIRTFV